MKPATFLTSHKNLLYLAVLAGAVFLIFLGSWLGGKITDSAEQKARLYQTATQVSNDDQLNYSIDTKQGRVLAHVSVHSSDLVKFPEMNKSFSYVSKKKEKYVEKQREVCEDTYDSEGNVDGETCRTETYYEWDSKGREDLYAKEIIMAGRKYPTALFSLETERIDAKDIIDGQDGRYVYERAKSGLFGRSWFSGDSEGDIRYSYTVMNLPQSGSIFLNTSEGFSAMFGSKVELHSKSAKELITDAQNASNTQTNIFNVFWTILVLVELIGLGILVYRYNEDLL